MNKRKFMVVDDSINMTIMQVPNEKNGIEIPSLCSNYSYKMGPKLRISSTGGASLQPSFMPPPGGFEGRNTDQFSMHDGTLNLHFDAELEMKQNETSRITPSTTCGLNNHSASGKGMIKPLKGFKGPRKDGVLKIPQNTNNLSISGFFSHEKSISFNKEMFEGMGNESQIEIKTQVQSLHQK